MIQRAEIINEMKSLALKGHEIFSAVLEKLQSLPYDKDTDNLSNQQLKSEHNAFKGKVDELQLKLTSSTMESKKLTGFIQDGKNNS